MTEREIDPDETEGRAHYRAGADALAKAQVRMAERTVKLAPYDPAKDAHDSYYAAIEAKRKRGDAARPIDVASDPICVRCASQQEGPVPTECTCGDAAGNR